MLRYWDGQHDNLWSEMREFEQECYREWSWTQRACYHMYLAIYCDYMITLYKPLHPHTKLYAWWLGVRDSLTRSWNGRWLAEDILAVPEKDLDALYMLCYFTPCFSNPK